MRGLGNTVARLAASSQAMLARIDANQEERLAELHWTGDNPGQLAARTYLPDGLPDRAPLVVILHGCTQNAPLYDRGSGWSELADRHGFALLFPEQRRANNSNLCFNWFDPAQARRGTGEARSIAAMVNHMVASHDLDPQRVYIAGLSAGGAMTAVMLATYPELFAGGAVIAGLPFAAANSLPEALERMRGHAMPSRRRLAANASGAAPPAPRRPTLSVWHGTHDAVVSSANADAIVDQWRDLYGLSESRGHREIVDGHARAVWRDADGNDLIEKYDIKYMGHGTPLDTLGDDSCGMAGPHMLEAGICSTRRIAAFWGLTGATLRPTARITRASEQPAPRPVTPAPSLSDGVTAIIEQALRKAGLMP